MFFGIIIRLLLILGAGFVAAVAIKTVVLTFKFVMAKVREKLRVKAGRRVLALSISKLVREITEEAERNGNIHTVDELLAELGEDGVIIASTDETYDVREEDIDIYSAKSVDDGLARTMQKNNGELVLAAS